MEFIVACVFIGLFIWLLPVLIGAAISIAAFFTVLFVGICDRFKQ